MGEGGKIFAPPNVSSGVPRVRGTVGTGTRRGSEQYEHGLVQPPAASGSGGPEYPPVAEVLPTGMSVHLTLKESRRGTLTDS